MGIFFEAQPTEPTLEKALLMAYESDPAEMDPGTASMKAAEVSDELAQNRVFKTGRFLAALLIFVVVAAVALATEVYGLTQATTALWGIVPAIFGVIVGLLGGEATTGS